MKKEDKITIHQLFWYFLIFSILGIIIETLYCYITTGIWESRKGLIWGPFCPVYGVGAAILLLFLNQYKNKSNFKLFIYGFVIGSIAEYLLSFGLETIYGMRFWDYGYVAGNLNGRICIQYSFYWGILSVILVKLIKPLIDKIIQKIKPKARNIIEIIVFIFLVIDCIFTVWGIQTYENRILNGKTAVTDSKNPISQIRYYVEENYFTNERISNTFPNLRIKDEKGNEIWVKTLIPQEKLPNGENTLEDKAN